MKILPSISLIAFLLFCIPVLGFAFPNDNPSEANESFKAFVKFDGVDGESQDANHLKWSDIKAFTQGFTKPGGGMTGQSRRRGAVVVEDITIVKELDKSGPKIAEAITKGKVYPKVEIAVTYNQKELYAYELKNVMVTSYNIRYDGDMPVEEISVNFEEIVATYSEYDKTGKLKGKVEYSYKVEKGEK